MNQEVSSPEVNSEQKFQELIARSSPKVNSQTDEEQIEESQKNLGKIPSLATVAELFRPEARPKFEWDGPGGFGHTECRTCHAKVDINDVDLDGRKHFDAPGHCAGYTQAERFYNLLLTTVAPFTIVPYFARQRQTKYPSEVEALLETISVYNRLSEKLAYIARHEPEIIRTKREIKELQQKLYELSRSAGPFVIDKGFRSDWEVSTNL